MRRVRGTHFIVLCLASVPVPTAAQVSYRQGPPKVADTPLAVTLLAGLRQELGVLATSMERYFMSYARYGQVLGPVGDTTRVQIDPGDGVTVALVYVTRNSWTGRATHDWLPGRSCVMSVGPIPPSRIIRTMRDRLAPTADMVAVCDPP